MSSSLAASWLAASLAWRLDSTSQRRPWPRWLSDGVWDTDPVAAGFLVVALVSLAIVYIARRCLRRRPRGQ